jgi:drug/metabolite transporter (DMT)-like permease
MVAAMTTEVAVGALAAAGASSCYEISYALQALEARRVAVVRAPHFSLLGRLARRPLWLGAMAIAALGWPLQLFALSRAPLTLVQPILALGIVLLLVLAARMLSERIGAGEIVCVAGIVIGVTGIAWAAPERTTSHAGPAALTLALAVLAAFVAAPYLIGALTSGSLPAIWLVLAAGAGDAWAAFGAKLIVDDLSRGRWLGAVVFGVGCGAALAGSLLSETFALQHYPASRVGPAVMAMQVVIPVVLAPLVGGENWGDTPLNGAVLALSLGVLTLSGAVLTASGPVSRLNEDEQRRRRDTQPAGSSAEMLEAAAPGNPSDRR